MLRFLVLIAFASGFSSTVNAATTECFPDKVRTSAGSTAEAKLNFSSSQAKTGAPVRLTWEVTAPQSDDDRYLIIALPNAVRFSGNGFLALPPGARAPRSLQTSVHQLRAIIPVGGHVSVFKGQLSLEVFTNGVVTAPWHLVEISSDGDGKCSELILSSGTLKMTVSQGAPELVLQDRFTTERPTAIHHSVKSKLILSIFDTHYQVHDETSGDLLLERPGSEPRFSPSGRYVTAKLDPGRIEVIDTLARRVVYTSSTFEVGYFGSPELTGWMNEDTILVLAFSRQGGVAVAVPLVDGRLVIVNDHGCNHGCTGSAYSGLAVDLDRIAFSVVSANVSGEAHREAMSLLEVADTPSTISAWDSSPAPRWGKAPRRPAYKIAAFDQPFRVLDRIAVPAQWSSGKLSLDWRFSDKVLFTNSTLDDADPTQPAVARHLLKPTAIDLPPVIEHPADGPIARRGFSVNGAPIAPRTAFDRLKAGLAAFGVPLADLDLGRRTPETGTAESLEGLRLTLAKSILSAASRPNSPLKFREDLPKAQRGTAVVAKNYSHFVPDDDSSSTQGSDPLISARNIDVLWRFDWSGGTVQLVQQSEWYGTGPDEYGDIVAIVVPRSVSERPTFTRIASAGLQVGTLPSGAIDDQTATGRALELAQHPDLVVSIAQGRYLLVGSGIGQSAAIFELPSMRRVMLLEHMTNGRDLQHLAMSSDGKHLVQINSTGELFFYSVASSQLVLNGRFIDDELVLYDRALKFESTPEGASYVYVQIPGERGLFALDQFASQLRTPGVAADRLRGVPAATTVPSGITPPNLSVRLNGTTYIVSARASSGLAHLRVQVDGILARTIVMEGSENTVRIPVADFLPARWISFAAEDKRGLISLTRAFPVPFHPYRGSLTALAIGVDAFQASGVPDLHYAVQDAVRFEKAVKEHISPSFSSYAGKVLAGPSVATVDAEITAAARQMKAGDTLILFVSSHGLEGCPPSAPMRQLG